MLKIRFQRFGKKNQPTYRMVLIDSQRSPKSGNFLEILGSYNPKTKEKTLKEEKIIEHIGKGAQVSDTVNNFLIKYGVIKGSKRDVSAKKKGGDKEKSEDAKTTKEPTTKEPKEETSSVEETKEEVQAEVVKDETPIEETKEELPKKEEAPKEEVEVKEIKEETLAEEVKEEKKEEESGAMEKTPVEEVKEKEEESK